MLWEKLVVVGSHELSKLLLQEYVNSCWNETLQIQMIFGKTTDCTAIYCIQSKCGSTSDTRKSTIWSRTCVSAVEYHTTSQKTIREKRWKLNSFMSKTKLSYYKLDNTPFKTLKNAPIAHKNFWSAFHAQHYIVFPKLKKTTFKKHKLSSKVASNLVNFFAETLPKKTKNFLLICHFVYRPSVS